MFLNLIEAILAFALLIASHEFGHFIAAKLTGTAVEEFAIGFGPRLFATTKGETIYSIRLLPLGGFNKLADEPGKGASARRFEHSRVFVNKPIRTRALILAFGPIMNYVLAIVLLFSSFMMGISEPTMEVGQVLEGSAADEHGFRVGDKVVKVNGVSVNSWEEMVAETQKHPGERIEYEVVRGGKTIQIEVTLGVKDGKGFLGVGPRLMTRYLGPASSAYHAFKLSAEATVFFFSALGLLFAGKLSLEQARPVSPVGIVSLTQQMAAFGVQSLLVFVALISIALALSNLLPIPPFDGGHLLFLLVEKLRGKRLDERVQRAVSAVGVSVLVIMFLIALYMDIFRPIDLTKL